ncbi:MAG: S41 family peptidase [Bacteroidota bacterium]|nr:S41 family peptidase [Bacteroidota bacterium]
MKNKVYFLPIALVCIVIGAVLGSLISSLSKRDSAVFSDKLGYVINLISNQYVDKVNTDSLTDNAISLLLEELDPHSVYLTKQELKKENESLRGNFDGIGVQFRIVKDTIVVVKTIKRGPSEKVGIMAGDRIVKVDGKNLTKNITNDSVLHYLKGTRGSKVKLSVQRRGAKKLMEFEVTRDKIETKAVAYYGMIDKQTGYIKLTEFSATAYEEVYNALQELNNRGMKKLVFDLRGNGGGLLDQAINIADEFIAKGDLIVYTQGLHRGRRDFYATSGGLFEKGELLVLIDELSASASEIVSGCIQDNDRGKILGRRTFGKGLVQEQRELPDNSAIRLTVARYYTPSGRCIQRPYTNGNSEKYYEDFLLRYSNMETGTDTISHSPEHKYKTKLGRVVYGGGGIEPDVTLSFGYKDYSTYYKDLIRQGLIFQYCFEFVDKNRKNLSQYASGEEFIKQFEVKDTDLNNMLLFASNNGVKKQNLSPKESSEIKKLMKAYITQNLWEDKYFYSIYLTLDNELQEALKK